MSGDKINPAHYGDNSMDPYAYCHHHRLGLMEGNIIKYVTRWRLKNGKEDLLKARNTIDRLIVLEYPDSGEQE